ncbi:exocyst complex component SEC10B-like protein, partial [Tanacetum coccineum]
MCNYIKTILGSTIKIPIDYVPEIVTAKNLTTMVNQTSSDMTELVELISQLVHNMDTSPPPFNVIAEREKVHNSVFQIRLAIRFHNYSSGYAKKSCISRSIDDVSRLFVNVWCLKFARARFIDINDYRLLLPVDGAHSASCEEMATTMSSAEGAAYKGLQQCIKTVMPERLLSAEQKVTDYKSPDDGIVPDHRPTNACI